MAGSSITRRDFLKGTGIILGSLCLSNFQIKEGFAQANGTAYPYRDWEDIYRAKWTWDKVVRGTHMVNCWYQSSCCFDLYVKNGVVVREEQTAAYPQIAPDSPDFNPRGCNKGACYSERMYDPCRVKYPLRRVGNRGEGKWKRITWDEALTEVANTMIDVITKEGSDRVIWELGTQLSFGNQGVALPRLGVLLGTPLLDMNAEIGDDHHGAAVTFGKIMSEGSADNWFHTDLFLIWGGNPFYTNIPNAHFFMEGRYNGSKVVTIAPDYSPSSIHSDLWIPINVGTDAAFGLSIAQVIVQEKLYKTEFLKEQTDLPLLVRNDTRLLLREKDLKQGGRDDLFYCYDSKSKSIKEVPKTTLALGGLDPALEGEYEVKTLQGNVKVRPVFELLKSKLRDYTPEKTQAITGIHPETVKQLAHEIAKAKSVCNVTQSNFSKFYHGVLMERAQILVLALCGHFGKRGSFYSGFPFLSADAYEQFPFLKKPGVEGAREAEKALEPMVKKLKDDGYTDEMVVYEMIRQAYAGRMWLSGTLFWYHHGGLNALSGQSKKWDKYLKKDVDDYMKESLSKGWQYISPAQGKDPRVLFEYGGNILRRVRGYTQLEKVLFPKLKLLVTLDWRMSATALSSDIVLPCAGWYEKYDIKWGTPLMPYAHVGAKAVAPLFEARPEHEIFTLIAKKIQEIAKKRGVSTYKKANGEEGRLDTVYDDLTFNGYYTEKDDEKVAEDFVKISTNLKGVTWGQLKKDGFARFTNVGKSPATIGNATDIKPNESIVPFTWHTDKKVPYPTLTRRMQFYIDQELYLELGEELPTYKEPPKVGGNHPLVVTGGHTRWSIHSSWRDNSYMLRQQRGVPIMYMSVPDAKKRGILDGDEVEVKNDLNSFNIHAKVSPGVRPGQVMIYHAWENYQFKDRKLFQNLMPSPINPIELAGGYYHLRPMFLCLHPGQSDRDTRVEVVKVKKA